MQGPAKYTVNLCTGVPEFDSLPVAKIASYPLEKRDYKPFAQCVLCFGEDAMYLRMWAFEVSPMPDSELVCVCCPYADAPQRALCVRVRHGEGDLAGVSVTLLEKEKSLPLDDAVQSRLVQALHARPHNGEDLQGVYWGMAVTLPIALLEELGGKLTIQPGGHFPGNFYKLSCDARFAHQGSYFPAQFPDAPFSPQSMGRFELVLY